MPSGKRNSHMYILLFIFYSLLCGYGIWKIPFFQKSGIRPVLLLGLFALHVLTGCLHNMIAWRYYPGHGDIWGSFYFSLVDRHLLQTAQFHQLWIDNSTWDLFSHNGVRFVLVILNFFSFDNLYIDTLLFSFPVFLGNIALYRVFRRRFPADPLTAITIIILPSTLFWSSCIHREAVLYMSLGFLFYWLDRISAPTIPPQAVPTRPRTPAAPRTRLYAVCCFLVIVYFRTVVAALLIPALLAWWLTERPLSRRQAILLSGAFVAILVLFISIPGLSTLTLHKLSRFQGQFQALEGHSRLYLPAIDGTWKSLLHVFPAAVRNGLFEPLPGSGGQQIYLAFSVELILVWVVVLAAIPVLLDHIAGPSSIGRSRVLLLRSTNPLKPSLSAPPSPSTLAFSRCCLIFALLGMLMVGAIVPFAGAIVRYRSLYLPFLLAPFLHALASWPQIRRLNQRLATWLPEPDLYHSIG
jgi:hypothetical protein